MNYRLTIYVTSNDVYLIYTHNKFKKKKGVKKRNMNFEMVGKIAIGKETDKFKPYVETKYESGWVKRRLIFNAICGDNRHSLTVDSGSFADGHGDVYTFTKSSVDESGNTVKGESIKIPFKERLTSKRLPEVAEFRKFVIDLEEPGRRRELVNASEKIKNGTSLTDEELEQLGIESESDVKEALEKSNKKKHEFISEWDFCEYIKKVIDSGKYKDRKFFIRGTGAYQYSDKNQKIYESLIPNRIYLANSDTEEYSTATVNVLFNNESVDDASVDDNGKIYVNGYHFEYDNGGRKDADGKTARIPVPVTIVIPCVSNDADEKSKKRVDAIKKKFTTDTEEYREYGCEVNMLNGSQKTEITEEMLTDEQKEDLDCGLITMDDIRKELGQVYGDRITEWQFIKPARGYTKGSVETVYTSDDMIIKDVVDDDEDLFDEDDDI